MGDEIEYPVREDGCANQQRGQSTRYRFGQKAIQGHTAISEDVSDEKAHS